MKDSNPRQPLLTSKSSKTSVRSQSQYQPVKSLNFFQQVPLLTHKNLLITFKNPKNMLFLILTPFILSLFLFGLQSMAIASGDRTIPNPSTEVLPPFPQCWWDNCISLQVSYITNNPNKPITDYPWIQNITNMITNQLGVTPTIRSAPISSFSTLEGYYHELEMNPNRTQISLLMCGDTKENFGGDTIANFCATPTSDYTYYLLVKKINSMGIVFHALDQAFPIDTTALALKTAVDKAIINNNLNIQNANPIDIETQTGRFPLTHNRYIHDYDIVTAAGAFYYMIPALFVLLFVQSQIVREKEYKLRQGLNIYGAKHSAYWFSWFIIAVIYSLVASLSSFLAGLAFSFRFFTDTPAYIIILFMYFPFCLAMSMMAFMISTIAPNTKAANASSYGIVLLAIVVQSFVADNNILTLLFTTDASLLVKALRTVLLFYPPFNYTKIFTNITIFSGYHFDIDQRSWLPGPHPYDLQTFAASTSGPLFTGSTFERYSDLSSMGILYGNAALFAILTWYFDHVIASNRGRADPLLFPIYWLINLFKKQSKKKATKKIRLISKPKGEQQQSATRQKNRVYQNSQRNIPALGLRIKSLSKTFKSTCSKQQVNALNQLTLQIQPGELMGVLGHNGAGKTTLVNILTGVLAPDESQDTEIIINRQSINKINQIRKFIGLCAQFDILWLQLTAYQHLNLFAKIKGIPAEQLEDNIKDLLQMVGLTRQIHNKVGGFSGGMKRRLSLAMAAIGNPKIILLDQPTTGLDPKVRQQVWALIGKLKENRSIILTTHSMQQADVLADRVCVMVKGGIRCIGSSLFLKQLYGKGHRLTLNIDKAHYSTIEKSLKIISPLAEVIDFKGGNLVIGIEDFQNLIKLIKVLQSDQPQGLQQYEFKKSIRDWAVSHTTLEEVFMAVSKQKPQN